MNSAVDVRTSNPLEIDPRDAWRRQQGGALLIDVRGAGERAAGTPDGAVGIVLDALVSSIGSIAPEPDREIFAICATGRRSLIAVERLRGMGYRNVRSVRGGFVAWRHEQLPIDFGPLDADAADRYSRHLRLPEVGVTGQARLGAARVVLIGAGGLGSPAAFYLAAAGVGTLVLADDDVVERSNLQRQILHADDRVGLPKVTSATHALSALNPRTRVETVAERVTAANVERVIGAADVVLDGADNFPVRYLLNDACVRLGKPLVYGAVHRFEGQVSVFDAGRHRGEAPCYRCLFPQPPAAADAPNCSEAGVLGVLPGVIGMLQATEVIKLLLGLGEPLAGRLLTFDALAMRFRETRLAPDPACTVCAPGREFPGYIDYAAFCAGGDSA